MTKALSVIRTDATTLLEALQGLKRAVAAKTSLPVLSMVLLEVGAEGLALTATDLDLAVRVRVAVGACDEAQVCVPYARLTALLKEWGAVAVTLKLFADRCTVTNGDRQFTLIGIPAEEFPALPTLPWDKAFVLVAEGLQALLSRVAFAVSTEESRPILHAVLFEGNGSLVATATDGHRLMTASVAAGIGTDFSVLLPSKAVQQLLKGFSADASLTVATDGNHLGVRSGTTELYTRLIEGPYPNWKQVLPGTQPTWAEMDRSALISAVKRLATIATDETRRVRLAFAADGTLVVTAVKPDVGSGEEELAGSLDGSAITLGANAEYLLQMLAHIPTERVRIGLKAPERAMSFESVAESGPVTALGVLMPLRLAD